jgi:hypothetical protein
MSMETETEASSKATLGPHLLAEITAIADLPEETQLSFFLSLLPFVFLSEDQIRSLFLVYGSDLLFLFTLLSGETVRFPPPPILRRQAIAYNGSPEPVDIQAAVAAESSS